MRTTLMIRINENKNMVARFSGEGDISKAFSWLLSEGLEKAFFDVDCLFRDVHTVEVLYSER